MNKCYKICKILERLMMLAYIIGKTSKQHYTKIINSGIELNNHATSREK